MKAYIGIDIGKSGAVAAIFPNDEIEVFIAPKIGTEIDQHELAKKIQHLVNHANENNWTVIVVAEDVHSLFRTGAKANFQFGRSLGIIEGILCAKAIRFEKVTPKTWQKVAFQGIPEMKKPGRKERGRGNNDTKAMAKLAAARLYPHVDVRKSEKAKVPHDGIVDALLIAHYATAKYPS